MIKKTLAMLGVIAVSATGLVVMSPDTKPAFAETSYGDSTLEYGEETAGRPHGLWSGLSGSYPNTGFKIEASKDNPRGTYYQGKDAEFDGLSDLEADYIYTVLDPSSDSWNGGSMDLMSGNELVVPSLTDGPHELYGLWSPEFMETARNRKAALLSNILEWYSVDAEKGNTVWDKEYDNQIVREARAYAAVAGYDKLTITNKSTNGLPGVDGADNERGTPGTPGTTVIEVTNEAGVLVPFAPVHVSYAGRRTFMRTDENGELNLSKVNDHNWAGGRTFWAYPVLMRKPDSDVCRLVIYETSEEYVWDEETQTETVIEPASKIITNGCGGPNLDSGKEHEYNYVSGMAGPNGKNGPVTLSEPIVRDLGCGRAEVYNPHSSEIPYEWVKTSWEDFGEVTFVPRLNGYWEWEWKDPASADQVRVIDLGQPIEGDCELDSAKVLESFTAPTFEPSKWFDQSDVDPVLGCVPFEAGSGFGMSFPNQGEFALNYSAGMTYEVTDSLGRLVKYTNWPGQLDLDVYRPIGASNIYTVTPKLHYGYTLSDPNIVLPSWEFDLGERIAYCAGTGDPALVPTMEKSAVCDEPSKLSIPTPWIEPSGGYGRMAAQQSAPWLEEPWTPGPPRPIEERTDLNYAFVMDRPTATTGIVTVTLKPGPLFAIPLGQQTEWSFDITPEPCAVEKVEVVPLAPTLFEGPDCIPFVLNPDEDPEPEPEGRAAGRAPSVGSFPSVQIPYQEGVHYHATNTGDLSTILVPADQVYKLIWNRDYTITASALPGFVIPEGVQTSWNLKTVPLSICAEMGVVPEVQAPATCGVGSTIKTVPFSNEFAPYTWSADPASALTTGATGRVVVTATLKNNHSWTDPNQQTQWVFDLPEIVPCDVLVNTVTPTVTPAATCGVGATVSLPNTEGVVYAVDKPDAREKFVTVTATTLPGFSFTPGAVTQWILDLGLIEPCDIIVQTVTPTVTPAQSCGVGARLVLPVTEGVVYTVDRLGAIEGPVTVTATTLPGFAFAEGSVTSWDLDLGTIKACDTIVQTETPTIDSAQTCGVGATLILPTTEGVVYTADRADAREGIVMVTATTLPGFAFAQGIRIQWTLDLGTITACDSVVNTVEPTITPAATCGVGAELVLPITEGVTYTSDRPDAREGIVTVTATTLPGFAFAEGSVTSWTLDLGTIKACSTIVTPLAPGISAATACGVGDKVALPQQEGVIYTADKPDADQGVVVVTAIPASGFVFAEGSVTSWTLDLGTIEPCDVIVNMEVPTIRAADTCGLAGTVSVPEIEGVVFDWDKSLTEGAVVVTARVLEGFAFPENATTSWTLDLGQITPCDVIVTAQKPTVLDAKSCGMPKSLSLPQQEGVVYSVNRTDAKEGVVTVTATTQAGFAFAEDSQTSWTLDLGQIEPCGEELPWTGADSGVIWMIVGSGAALMLVGAVLLVLSPRRRS